MLHSNKASLNDCLTLMAAVAQESLPFLYLIFTRLWYNLSDGSFTEGLSIFCLTSCGRQENNSGAYQTSGLLLEAEGGIALR